MQAGAGPRQQWLKLRRPTVLLHTSRLWQVAEMAGTTDPTWLSSLKTHSRLCQGGLGRDLNRNSSLGQTIVPVPALALMGCDLPDQSVHLVTFGEVESGLALAVAKQACSKDRYNTGDTHHKSECPAGSRHMACMGTLDGLMA